MMRRRRRRKGMREKAKCGARLNDNVKDDDRKQSERWTVAGLDADGLVVALVAWLFGCCFAVQRWTVPTRTRWVDGTTQQLVLSSVVVIQVKNNAIARDAVIVVVTRRVHFRFTNTDARARIPSPATRCSIRRSSFFFWFFEATTMEDTKTSLPRETKKATEKCLFLSIIQ